eukprot:CAMPEP_0197591382 /NCGR_PEP_ID=MMETSP1326-20131121/13050_1 /TAXON_ID=1155430 /ORGANISM="Genus nov. species nov., Strain RCC2288" /LENGTH=114 /DNA_ID=CAMNT_0043156795 /DNA_START=40 /DNA_END=380 /DNA_ORIENTATION=-
MKRFSNIAYNFHVLRPCTYPPEYLTSTTVGNHFALHDDSCNVLLKLCFQLFQRVAAGPAAPGDDDDECCALCKSMPYLSVVRCTKCWSEAEWGDMEAAAARARAAGISAAGAAW